MITGGSEGLGLALGMGFAAAGARVSICARNGQALERARERIAETGGDCLAIPLDVTDEPAVTRWVERTAGELGDPSVLINSASILGDRVELSQYSVETWRAVIEVNLTGAFLVTRAVLPRMLASGRGSVVNVSSGAALPPRTRWGAYAVSKLALDGFTINLAEELKGTAIRVNAVDPGSMRTGMRAAAYPEEDPATVKTPEANLPVFLWLASDESTGVSGRRIVAAAWLRDRGLQ